MIDTIKNYFLLFLHPVDSALSYDSARNGDNSWRYRVGFANLEISETILVSWIFVFIQAIYQVALIYIFANFGAKVYENNTLSELANSFLGVGFTRKTQLMYILMGAVLFPISAWIYTKFWALIIRFSGKLFGFDEILLYKESKEISKNALVSNAFCLVPIFGEILRQFYGVLHIFFGLKGNLKMSNVQAITVLLVPVLFVGAWFILMTINLFMIFM